MVPNHPRYQLRYTRIFSFLLSVVVVKDVVKRLFSEFLGKMQSAKMPVFARGCGISDFARMPGVLHAPKAGAIPSSLYPVVRFRRDIIPNTTAPCKVFRIDVFSSL